MFDEQPSQKRCSKCGETKPFEAFSNYKRSKDGRKARCKACINQEYAANPEQARDRSRAYYAANTETICEKNRAYYNENIEKKREQSRRYRTNYPDKIREQQRVYRATHAEEIREKKHAYCVANAEKKREYDRAYRLANSDKIRATKRAYRANNADAIRERRKQRAAIISAYKKAYRERNKEAIRQYQRAWKNANQDHIQAYRNANMDIFRAACQQRRARIKGNGGTFTSQELVAMRIMQAGVCAYCKRLHDPDELTIDHVIPIDQGGRHEVENIVLACGICNSSKNNRTPAQWTKRWYEDLE